MTSRASLPRFALLFVFFGVLAHLPAQTSGSGSIAGVVNNVATNARLGGANVSLPALGRTVQTDAEGRFLFTGVPPGDHEVVASYTGLDTQTLRATVTPGGRAALSFDLTSAVYQLPEFKVTGEREGSAAAITAQRNAANVKNVVAMDSFGNLPNMSAGELAIRLPGVAGSLDDEGNVTGLIVRGMSQTLNRVTVDGGLMANVGGLNRQFQTHSLTGAMFDSLEVIKGHTPDQEADSLGGTVNLKTRSPLSMKEKRRVTYSLSGRWAPPFTEQIPLREAHRLHPLFNLAYQEVFDAFGGEHNLGVAVNTFYSENVAGYFRTIRDYQNTTTDPAYLWDYRTQDAYNNRKQSSVNVKVDYRLSPTTKFSLNTIYNDAFEPFNRLYETRAYTGSNSTVPNATTSGVIPGFTDLVTSVRPVSGSVLDVTETMYSFRNRTRQVDFGAEHDFDRLKLDYNLVYSRTHNNLGVGGGGTLTNRIKGVGWTLDRTQSDLYPAFTQTAGPDMTNPANYLPNGYLTARNSKRNVEIAEYRLNASYDLPTELPVTLKSGLMYRHHKAYEVGGGRRWSYTGTTALPVEPSIITWDSLKTGRKIPQWETASLFRDGELIDTTLWKEDLYYAEQVKYTGTRGVTEQITAGYGMAQGKIRRLGWLAGVRVEKTEDESYGWTKAKVGSTTAEQTANPVAAAAKDYANNRRDLDGSYTQAFPSAHLTYDITPAVKARLSWSTSFGRPVMTNLVPGESFSDTNKTLTINNVALQPQAAENWDASVEYYFEPVGQFTVGWFHKTIEDYIVRNIESGVVGSGNDNGYNGDYAGYTILTSGNAGTAYVQGWELSYQQQFTFLPGLLKTLAFSANYTELKTHGNFGQLTSYLTTNDVAGFVPRTANASLSWRYRALSFRALLNYTGDHIRSYTAGSPGRNQYRFARTVINLGASYQVRPWLSLTVDVNNLTNEPDAFYRYSTNRMERTIIQGTTINFGVAGRF